MRHHNEPLNHSQFNDVLQLLLWSRSDEIAFEAQQLAPGSRANTCQVTHDNYSYA
jgi:hypothetical protein